MLLLQNITFSLGTRYYKYEYSFFFFLIRVKKNHNKNNSKSFFLISNFKLKNFEEKYQNKKKEVLRLNNIKTIQNDNNEYLFIFRLEGF